MALRSKTIPNTYKTTRKINELNQQWKIRDTPGQAEGVQISFKESLGEQIANLQRKGDLEGDTIGVKISGDGTNIGKKLKLVNVTCTILNEKEAAMSEKGNYVLAILKTSENYDNLKESLSDLTQEMSKLNKVTVEGKTYNIKYFLGGDWKFLACVFGLGAANQDYACIWCKCFAARDMTSKGYGHFLTVLRVPDHWRKFQALPNQKSLIAKQLHYLISYHLIMSLLIPYIYFSAYQII